jgi:hypothetical protein
LGEQIRQLVTIARSHRDAADRHGAISADMRALWLALLRRHGCTLPNARIDEVLGTDLELNTQGLIAWLDRERKS